MGRARPGEGAKARGGGRLGAQGRGAWEAQPKVRDQKHRRHPYASRRRCDVSGITLLAGERPGRRPPPPSPASHAVAVGERRRRGFSGLGRAFPAGDPRRRLIRKGAFGHELLVGCRDDVRVSPGLAFVLRDRYWLFAS